jgi:hypothetical protein
LFILTDVATCWLYLLHLLCLNDELVPLLLELHDGGLQVGTGLHVQLHLLLQRRRVALVRLVRRLQARSQRAHLVAHLGGSLVPRARRRRRRSLYAVQLLPQLPHAVQRALVALALLLQLLAHALQLRLLALAGALALPPGGRRRRRRRRLVQKHLDQVLRVRFVQRSPLHHRDQLGARHFAGRRSWKTHFTDRPPIYYIKQLQNH